MKKRKVQIAISKVIIAATTKIKIIRRRIVMMKMMSQMNHYVQTVT